MKNLGTKKLESKRLILRRCKKGDAKQIFDNYGSDPVVSKYVVWDKHNSVEDSQKLVEKWIESYKNKNSYKWVIVDKASNNVIGSISAVKVNTEYKTVEVGYCLGSKWWNKGYATEALKRIIKFFFEEIGVETIYANHLADNPASGKVMQKSKMKHDGTLRNRMIDKNTNKPMNLEAYSIIKKDYYEE